MAVRKKDEGRKRFNAEVTQGRTQGARRFECWTLPREPVSALRFVLSEKAAATKQGTL